ncbi:MAG: hypothetical protein K8R77_04280 [Anaerolineaceae bacterium]|nr:hypothetical protein [Anaerolineaceae bacterium]
MQASPSRSPILSWLIAAAILLTAAIGIFHTARTSRLPDLTCRQNHTEIYIPLDNHSPLTQTIQPAADRLTSLTLYPQVVSTGGQAPYTIYIQLQDNNDPALTLAETRRPLTSIRYGKAQFFFSPLRITAGQTYRLTIATDAPPDILFLAASDSNRYPDGELRTIEGQLLPQDIAFNTYSRPSFAGWLQLIYQTIPTMLRWLGWTVFFTLIGLALLFIIHPQTTTAKSGPGQLSILFLQSFSLGLALTIFIGYTQSVLRLSINSCSLLVCGLLLLTGVFLRWLLDRRKHTARMQLPRPGWEDAGVLFLLLFSFASRAVQTAGLEPVPLWVDGFNHFSKLSLLAKDEILPLHINYPYGYHLLAYLWHLIHGLDLPAAAFQTGFWLSAIAVPAAYPLTRRLLPQRGFALLAIILYGFFTPFPAYLATWSRFPFLLGLTLLHPALSAALDWLDTPYQNLSREVLLAMPPALLAAALVLSHYGTAVHWAAFILTILLVWRIWPNNNSSLRLIMLRLCGLALPAAAILMLKIISLMQRGLWQAALSSNQSADQAIDLRYTLNLTTQGGGWLVWGLALAGLLAALIWKPHRKITIIVFGWLLILYSLDVFQLLLLGTAVSSLMNYIIALSLPLSWLAASALSGAFQSLKSFLPHSKFLAWPLTAGLACLLLTGFVSISGIINPVTILFTAHDQEAMAWIKEQTPQNAVFFIDSFQWGSSMSPANGGGWITALTNRQAVYPYTNQQKADLQDFLAERHTNYIYTQRHQPLEGIPLFVNAEPVFRNEQVIIYELPSSSPVP